MGRRRTDDDGCRRYLPIALTFDTRAYILNTKIEDDWEEDSRQQWTRNQRLMREALLHEYGVQDGERKIGDFAAMDAAPWSVVGPHNEVVTDVRRAFAAGSYYSALLGAAGLGERILNDLVLRLRTDYAGHPSTGNVAEKKSFNDWNVMTQALRGWGVLDEGSARSCAKFAKLRNDVVHYRSDRVLEARGSALEAMNFLALLISHVFAPLGGPPRFIPGTTGHSFIALAAEKDPVVRHYFIPSCVLVSPEFEFRSSLDEVWDEQDYRAIYGVGELSDEAFANRYGGKR